MAIVKEYIKKEFENYNINQLSLADYIKKSTKLIKICEFLGIDIELASKTILDYRPFSMNCFFKCTESQLDFNHSILIEKDIAKSYYYESNILIRTNSISLYLVGCEQIPDVIYMILLGIRFPYFLTNPIFEQKKNNINEVTMFYLEYYQEPINLKRIISYNVEQTLALIEREKEYINKTIALPTIITTYGLSDDIYIKCNDDDESLHVPIISLLNNDWNGIVKRHTEYFTNYYRSFKPEMLPGKLKLLETPIALELKRILEQNK
jgi:hypothetical protein